MFSIKAASEATGLGVETLRAWERRYGIVVPARDGSGRRIYSASDIVRLRRLREATDRGHPIGRLAGLRDDELETLLGESGHDPTSQVFIERILRAVQAFDVSECEQALMLAIATVTPMRLMTDIVGPLLTEIGEGWHRGELSIAQEHMVSALLHRHLALVLQTFDRCAGGSGVVFSTLPGERHELGLMMAATTCASLGHKAHYLGPDMPAEDIALFAARTGSPIVALSIVSSHQLADVPPQLSLIANQSDGTPREIWLGGAAARQLPRESLPAACVVLTDQFDLERRLQMLRR